MSDRMQVLTELANQKQIRNTIDEKVIGKTVPEIFGMNVFNDDAMKAYIPYKTYERLSYIVKNGGQIDDTLAEEVAHGVKEWAISKGASHYTHWFQPMTGLTAEKHDSFLSFDDKGLPINRFSGKNLKQGEPDASSFPSGGIRATFEARGYTAWDPTSPIFIMEGPNGNTLSIPTIFISYTGEVLDKKSPLLKSMEAINKSALRVLKLFGSKATRVFSTMGPEQEYFLVDKNYYLRRPDLIHTGRTLFGAKPPRGQQMEDHYFGSIKDRIMAYMQEVEIELFKLGIPAKTRHNEVAPAQFEIAPIFEDTNIATDHNNLVMEILRKVAGRYNLSMLIHEKPFAGVNGSGKHNNWSMSDNEGNNLLEPGKTPHENLQFLTFLAATMKAVYKYSDVLRTSVATPGNDHRLGANEAPPAIISIFLGEQLTKIMESLENNTKLDYSEKAIIDLGISKLPVISKDNTDRNRTSPFAFTGNKFEFRAVGSSQNIAGPNFTINSMISVILNEVADGIEANLKKGMELNKAVMEVIVPIIKETNPIRFEGNNYDPEWEKEAARRGLPNRKNTPESLKDFVSQKNIDMFVKAGVLTEKEIKSRYMILVENYIKTLNIEAETALTIAKTMILPAVLEYQTVLANAVNSLSSAGVAKDALKSQSDSLAAYAGMVKSLSDATAALESALAKVESGHDEEKKADDYNKTVKPAMDTVRAAADKLEEVTGDCYWPLPKYREMLFNY